jgi:hypothetical protein
MYSGWCTARLAHISAKQRNRWRGIWHAQEIVSISMPAATQMTFDVTRLSPLYRIMRRS